jgi:hypothetical protein
MSIWTTRAPAPIRLPFRVVHRVSDAPNARTTSASRIARAASGGRYPPAMPAL